MGPSEAAFQDVRDIRLNYIITQVDISRMARNASRHLDVKSILSLPTIVYQEPQQQQGKEEEDDDDDFLSSSCCSSESPPASLFVEQQHGDNSNSNSASNAADVVLPSEAAFQDVRDIRLNYIITQVD